MVTKQKIAVLCIIFSFLTAAFVGFLNVPTVYAQEGDTSGTTSEGLECDGVKTSIIGGDICDGEDGQSTIFNLLVWVLRILTAGVGIAAVGGIGYGALLYTTAEGKPDQTKKAIGIITNVVIGIAAYALMAVLLNFLIPGGILQ